MSTDIEGALRAELAARAETAQLRPSFQAEVERGVVRDKARRRVAAGSALALLAGVGIAAPSILHAGIDSSATANGPAQLALAQFPLLQIPTRGSLAGDGAFTADATRVVSAVLAEDVAHLGYGSLEPSTVRLLYAGDDGVLRYVVVAGVIGSSHADSKQGSNATAAYDAFVGPSGTSASGLRPQGVTTSNRGDTTFALAGQSAGPGKPTPLIALGPTSMTDIEYSAEAPFDSRLQPRVTGVPMRTADGAAIGEIPGTTNAFTAYGYAMLTVFKAKVNGHTTYHLIGGSSTPTWVLDALTSDPTIVSAHQALQNLLSQRASAAGLTLGAQDAFSMSVRQTLDDLAAVQHLSITQLHETVAWIGLEKPGTGAVVLDVTMPGLPTLQLFIDGNVGNSGAVQMSVAPLIRVAPSHDTGQVPTTRAQFTGGIAFQPMGMPSGLAW